jgi:hypothetical protein
VRIAIARMALVALAILAAYGLVLLLIEQSPYVEVRNYLALGWTAVFLVGLGFATWNAYDSVLDVWDAFKRHRPRRIVAGGQWLARSNVLQGIACLMLALTGWSVILMLGTAELRAGLLVGGGVALVANQVWNRLDRERLQRLPGPSSEVRAMEALAAELAADTRTFGHDFDDALQFPVGVLEVLKTRADITPQEVLDIEAAVVVLTDLGAALGVLHARARALDPTLHPPEEAP